MADPIDVTRLLVVTDLDGCLLDDETQSYEAARPALATLASARCPLVLCSAKTRAEMERIARSIGLSEPFIVENGGALVFPTGSFDGELPGAQEREGCRVLAFGPERQVLIDALGEIAAEAGVAVRGFAAMTGPELEQFTGLEGETALLALRREYDEPFLLEDDARLEAFTQAAARRALKVSHGGRFYHLTGSSDKGTAFRMLLALYHRAGRLFSSAGLGDAATDLPLLRAVDRPILVPRRDGSVDPILASSLPTAECAPQPGPAGWNAAVLTLLANGHLPRLPPALRSLVPR
jgi:mannosyl-3-phosphoglycerate phosphatase